MCIRDRVIEYGRKGDVRIRAAFRTDRGSWSVSDGKLTLTSPVVPTRTSPYRLTPAGLVLVPGGKEQESRYRKVPAGACRLSYLEAAPGPAAPLPPVAP